MNSNETPPRIGRFFILRLLGSGGMGRVYLGYDEKLGRKLAIKVLHGDGNPIVRARLLREAQALAHLSHPHVVTIYEVGEEDDRIYIAMEYVEGRTLRQLAEENPQAPQLLLSHYLQAGNGLAAAHLAGILHRDFKPDNAIAGDDGRVRVLDFGLARYGYSPTTVDENRETAEPIGLVHDNLNTPMTVAGKVLGTPPYMSPEQLVGGPTDPRSDLFSFSVALWEALFGVRPFQAASIEGLSIKIETGIPNEGPENRPVSKRIRDALVKGLAANPDERWQTMNDLLHALTNASRRPLWPRLVGVFVAITIVATTATVYQTWRKKQAITACQKSALPILAVWDDAARMGIRAASKSEDPVKATAHIEALIDDYTQVWAETAVTICERGLEDESWTELANEANACLAERSWSLETLVKTLAAGDWALLQHGIRSAQSMPPIDDCLNAEKLARRPPPPNDPELLAEHDAIRELIAQAYVLRTLGNHKEALYLAKPLIERADALDWQPLRVRVRLLNGRLLVNKASEESVKYLREGYYMSFETGNDLLATAFATDLITAVGVGLMRPLEGRLWARQARALLIREPENRRLRLASIESRLGRLAFAEKAYDESEAAYRRALEITEEKFGPEHQDVGLLLSNIGGVYSNNGDLERAAASWERARRISEKNYGSDHPDTALIDLNLGFLHWEREEYAQALALTQRAATIWERALGPNNSYLVVAQGNMGDYYERQDLLPQALTAYTRALEIADQIYGPAHRATLEPLRGRANVHAHRGNLEAAITDLHRARAIEVKIDDPYGIATTDLRLASLFVTQDPERAEALINAAVARLYTSYGTRSDKMIDALVSNAEENIVNARFLAAIPLLERVLALSTLAVDPANPRIGGIEFNLESAPAPRTGGERTTTRPDRGLARIADARFALAQALSESGGEIERIEALVASAEALYLNLHTPQKTQLAKLRSWRDDWQTAEVLEASGAPPLQP